MLSQRVFPARLSVLIPDLWWLLHLLSPYTQRATVTGTAISGFGLSAFFFSTIAHAVFPGNTSGLLLTLAVGTAIPMVIGWFLIRPCPYPDPVAQTAVENGDRRETDEPSPTPDETSQLISKHHHTQHPGITGLALMCTVDFWILFSIMSLCEYFLYPIGGL